jgi:hypothetical protein
MDCDGNLGLGWLILIFKSGSGYCVCRPVWVWVLCVSACLGLGTACVGLSFSGYCVFGLSVSGYCVCRPVFLWVLCVSACLYLGTVCLPESVSGYCVCQPVWVWVLCVCLYLSLGTVCVCLCVPK